MATGMWDAMFDEDGGARAPRRRRPPRGRERHLRHRHRHLHRDDPDRVPKRSASRVDRVTAQARRLDLPTAPVEGGSWTAASTGAAVQLACASSREKLFKAAREDGRHAARRRDARRRRVRRRARSRVEPRPDALGRARRGRARAGERLRRSGGDGQPRRRRHARPDAQVAQHAHRDLRRGARSTRSSASCASRASSSPSRPAASSTRRRRAARSSAAS